MIIDRLWVLCFSGVSDFVSIGGDSGGGIGGRKKKNPVVLRRAV